MSFTISGERRRKSSSVVPPASRKNLSAKAETRLKGDDEDAAGRGCQLFPCFGVPATYF